MWFLDRTGKFDEVAESEFYSQIILLESGDLVLCEVSNVSDETYTFVSFPMRVVDVGIDQQDRRLVKYIPGTDDPVVAIRSSKIISMVDMNDEVFQVYEKVRAAWEDKINATEDEEPTKEGNVVAFPGSETKH